MIKKEAKEVSSFCNSFQKSGKATRPPILNMDNHINKFLPKSKRSARAHTRNNAINNFNHLLSCKRSTRALTLNMNNKKNKFLPKSKRSQITIFIIVAVLIVAIALVIFLVSPNLRKNLGVAENPEAFIQTCLEDKIKESAELISLQGGSIEPEFFYMYDNNKLQYLCYTNQYYELCTAQIPFLRKHIEDEIKSNIESDVDFCFGSLKENHKDSTLKEGEIIVELLPKRISTTINNEFTFRQGDSTKTQKSFRVVLNNNLYELVAIAQNIMDWEIAYGEAEPANYMSIYHELKVEKKKQTDETKIYIITDKTTGDKFQFASRSLPLPPGYGGENIK